MLPNHYMDVPLDDDAESIGYFSRACDGQVIVFVHGFMGDKLTTWDKMHELLLLEKSVAKSDVVFYGYSSVQPQARASAGVLRDFLASLAPMSASMAARLPPERRRLAHTDYRKILVVAHSLGGAIARRAILDGHREGDFWAQKTRLLLFAPAHCGAQLAELKKELAKTAKLVSWLSILLTPASQAVLDLERDSDFITELRTETAAELAKGSADCLKAKKVMCGRPRCKRNLACGLRSGASHVSGLLMRHMPLALM
jgi:pimeloyl-ACP methyl ester carboxylesterase